MERIRALAELHRAGIKTYAMIAPMLPGAEDLPKLLEGMVQYIRVDRMNYHNADWGYRKYGLEDKLSDEWVDVTGHMIASACEKLGIECRLVY